MGWSVVRAAFIICLTRGCTGVNGENLQLCTVHKNLYFCCKSRENPYQVLQVTCAKSEQALK